MGYPHFSHQKHELVICSKADYDQARCAACADKCTGLTYGCKECGFYIHYSCLLPEEISHPTHPTHSLFLDPVCADFTCSACHSQHNGFHFLCREPRCYFTIDVRCAFPLPAVVYPGHRHRLNFFNKLPEEVGLRQCNACHGPCRWLVLCCLDCKFGVHLVCDRPLCLFKHGESCCPSKDWLELKASINEEDVRRDLLRFCGVCLEEIGPQTPLYYCKDCQFIAHVECIFIAAKDGGEDLKMIRAEAKQDGEKKGNREAEEVTQNVETFGDIVNSLNDQEKAELEDVHKRRVAEIIKVLARRNNTGGGYEGIPKSPFVDEAFSEFMKRLLRDIPRTNSLQVASENEMVVEVAEYKMTQKLAPVLRNLFANFGDVGDESRLTLKPKIVVFVMLCGTISSMANTKIAGVTEPLLYNWWKYLMFVHLSGFKILFAIDRLKVVMRAHYTDLQDDSNSILRTDKKIRDLSEDIKELQSKLDRLKTKRGRMSGTTDGKLVEACSKNALAWEY